MDLSKEISWATFSPGVYYHLRHHTIKAYLIWKEHSCCVLINFFKESRWVNHAASYLLFLMRLIWMLFRVHNRDIIVALVVLYHSSLNDKISCGDHHFSREFPVNIILSWFRSFSKWVYSFKKCIPLLSDVGVVHHSKYMVYWDVYYTFWSNNQVSSIRL